MLGSKLSHYQITAKIGAGGMGEVYCATDTKLGRDVALKVLPAEMARDPERLARFQREARSVAALNHPHIVTIFSVEEADGVHFLTMELVEGKSLDQCIPEGGLPLERIIAIGSALAEALAAAHDKGIVHRDLKPANVMLTDDGRVKVLDFGLAKEMGVDRSSDLTLTSAAQTQVGAVMGTPPYMSPEQIAGRVVDHRTDIFSMGVMLHEMAAGQRPFSGASSAELASAILRDTPPLVSEMRVDLPADLARIIRRCLEKDPRHRIQTASDVGTEFCDLARQESQTAVVLDSKRAAIPSTSQNALRRDSGSARAEEGFWVAVLPFKYGSVNTELTALADGLSEDIVTGLSRFSYLRVISRSSTSRYAHEAIDVRAAAKEIGARYVMEGSIRQSGTRLRIAVQLVDAVSGAGLWAESYDLVMAADVLTERAGVSRLAVLGFCMGGMYALKADTTGRFERWIAFYGMIRLPIDWRGPGHAEPLDEVDRSPQCQVLAIIGEQDPFTPPADVEALDSLPNATTVRYPEADHGFVHDPDRPHPPAPTMRPTPGDG